MAEIEKGAQEVNDEQEAKEFTDLIALNVSLYHQSLLNKGMAYELACTLTQMFADQFTGYLLAGD